MAHTKIPLKVHYSFEYCARFSFTMKNTLIFSIVLTKKMKCFIMFTGRNTGSMQLPYSTADWDYIGGFIGFYGLFILYFLIQFNRPGDDRKGNILFGGWQLRDWRTLTCIRNLLMIITQL